MLNSAVSLLPILGGVGVGIAAPMIYEGVTVKNFQTSWKKRLDKSPYLLGSCQKQFNSRNYNIKLFLAEDDSGGGEDSNDRGLGLTVFVTANDGEKLFGGWSLKGDSSNKVQLSISPQTIDTSTLYRSQDFWNDFKDCPIEHIVFTATSSSSDEIHSYDIKFECEAKKYGFGKKKCDVRFSKENNLTFKEGFQPKLRFLAF